jgi:hypothetical protein
MPEIAILILVAVAVLMAKHMAADFFLQSAYQCRNKGTYVHPGGLLHSGIHVALTPLVYLVTAPVSLLLAIGIAVGEFAVHYHIDWAKEQIIRRCGWTPQTSRFWNALGFDQFLHGLTYLTIVAVLVWALS